ncbi:hypothetical protein K1719_018610 [Acacia pycnantha]|nr:hypothetical protein K1719_018610 [Acacia pycnantha]
MEDDKVTIDMKEMIQDCGDVALLPECCIYRVPLVLRQHNEEAYTPKFVSIGPFHYGKERLQDMERHKQIMFKSFAHKADRVGSSLDDLVHLVKYLEPKVRASYSETINLTKQELVKMTLIDSSFIIELFSSMWMSEIPNDAKLSLPSFQTYIFEDLLLFENQLPFFVIEELFNKAFPHDNRDSLPSFLELTYRNFGHFNRQNLKPNIDVKIKHFTDLLRLFYLQGKESQRQPFSLDQIGSHILSYNANVLKEAGIKLKVGTSKFLLDLKFSGHVLEIPKIYVGDRTELVFRNMIALEQCLYPHATYIADYALVMDCLIDTHKDVDLLVHKKIVDNIMLGDSHSVASLFNGLVKNVPQSSLNSDYFEMNQRLNGYCEDPWNKMKATLRRDYCNTPWRTVASIAGIIILVLTIVQAIISVLQVVLKK